MRCHDVQGLFSEIYDGVAEEQAILETHLRECHTCAAEYEEYCQLLSEVRQLPMPELPAGFHESVMAKIREVARQQKRTPAARAQSMARRWSSVAAAACVLLISLWGVRVFNLDMRMSNMDYAMPAPANAPMPMMGFIDDDMSMEIDAPGMRGIWDTGVDFGYGDMQADESTEHEYSVQWRWDSSFDDAVLPEVAASEEYPAGGYDSDYLHMQPNMDALPESVMFQTDVLGDIFILPLTYEDRDILTAQGFGIWDMAILGSIALLCISLAAAIFWNNRSKKQLKSQERLT